MQPLNRKIVVTRPEKTAVDFVENLKANGFEPLIFPLIKLKISSKASGVIQQIIENKKIYDWLLFTSPAAVHFYFSLPKLPEINKIAAIGEKTALLIEKKGSNVNFTPSIADFDTLLKEMPVTESQKVLFPHSEKTKTVQLDALRKKAQLTEIVLYENSPVNYTKNEWESILQQAGVFTFFSPSAVKSFCRQIKEYELTVPKEIKLISIGTKTTQALQKCCFTHQIITVPNGKTEDMIRMLGDFS